jgi:selenide,water dikinase
MFPQSRIPLDVLRDILRGGQDKVAEAGAVIVGGHTIDDYPPKYGLAVTGLAHPSEITTNAGARPGETVILTKPIGTGVLVAGHRLGEAHPEGYRAALESMKLLNKTGAAIMRKSGSRCATDVTGFGLLGHALKVADASKITIQFHGNSIPVLEDAYRLVDMGCIPGGAFRNQAFAEEYCEFQAGFDYTMKMLMYDPQTSGGLLFTVEDEKARDAIVMLRAAGFPHATVIGQILQRQSKSIMITDDSV